MSPVTWRTDVFNFSGRGGYLVNFSVESRPHFHRFYKSQTCFVISVSLSGFWCFELWGEKDLFTASCHNKNFSLFGVITFVTTNWKVFLGFAQLPEGFHDMATFSGFFLTHVYANCGIILPPDPWLYKKTCKQFSWLQLTCGFPGKEDLEKDVEKDFDGRNPTIGFGRSTWVGK